MTYFKNLGIGVLENDQPATSTAYANTLSQELISLKFVELWRGYDVIENTLAVIFTTRCWAGKLSFDDGENWGQKPKRSTCFSPSRVVRTASMSRTLLDECCRRRR